MILGLHSGVCIVQKIDALCTASFAYLICRDVDYFVSKLERYNRFHGTSSYTDVSYVIQWNFIYVVCDILAYIPYNSSSLVFSPKAGFGRNQSPVRRPVWPWHTAF